MYQSIFFYMGLAFILLHEMDAIRCKEWRIFPVLSRLPENTAYQIFVWAHIPLFYWIFTGLSQVDNWLFIVSVDLFLLAHLLAHLILWRHPENLFKDITSWIIISGAAIFGLLDLLFRFL